MPSRPKRSQRRAVRQPAAAYDALPEMLTIPEFIRVARISRNHCYQMVQTGELPHVRYGRVIRVPKTALRAEGR